MYSVRTLYVENRIRFRRSDRHEISVLKTKQKESLRSVWKTKKNKITAYLLQVRTSIDDRYNTPTVFDQRRFRDRPQQYFELFMQIGCYRERISTPREFFFSLKSQNDKCTRLRIAANIKHAAPAMCASYNI